MAYITNVSYCIILPTHHHPLITSRNLTLSSQIKKMFSKFYMRSYSPSFSPSLTLTPDGPTHTTPPVSTGVGVGSSGTTTTSSETEGGVEVSPYLLELQQEFVDKIKVCMVDIYLHIRVCDICIQGFGIHMWYTYTPMRIRI